MIYKEIKFSHPISIGGLVVKSVVAIDGPRVRFPADAGSFQISFFELFCVNFFFPVGCWTDKRVGHGQRRGYYIRTNENCIPLDIFLQYF